MEFLILTLIAIIGPFAVDLVANHYHKLPSLYARINPWHSNHASSKVTEKRISYYKKALQIKDILDKTKKIPKDERMKIVDMLSDLIQEINTSSLTGLEQRREIERKIKSMINELQKYHASSKITVSY